jgi:hypothetical protein
MRARLEPKMNFAAKAMTFLIAGLLTSASAGAADYARPLDVYGDPARPREYYVDPAPRSARYPTVFNHRGVPSYGPNCGVVSDVSPVGRIWLGHFTGGNIGPIGPVPGGVDWRSAYGCFPSRATCQAWQRDMRHKFSRLEGYRTCLVIR